MLGATLGGGGGGGCPALGGGGEGCPVLMGCSLASEASSSKVCLAAVKPTARSVPTGMLTGG